MEKERYRYRVCGVNLVGLKGGLGGLVGGDWGIFGRVRVCSSKVQRPRE